MCTVRMAPYRVRLYKQGGIHVVHHNETAYLNAISADGSHPILGTHSQINLSHLSKKIAIKRDFLICSFAEVFKSSSS